MSEEPRRGKKKPRAVPSSASPAKRRRPAGAAPEADPAIGRLAADVKTAYVRERNNFESMCLGRSAGYRPARAYDGRPAECTGDGVVLQAAKPSVWRRLAALFLRERIDPRLFMAVQFGRLGPDAAIPEPPQFVARCPETGRDCLPPKVAARWEQARRRKGREIAAALRAEVDIAVGRMRFLQLLAKQKSDDSYAMTLLDAELELSALFRYCLARSLPGKRFRQIAEFFEPEACLQFERYRTFYLRYWTDFLPDDLPDRAREVYGRLYEEVKKDVDQEEEAGPG